MFIFTCCSLFIICHCRWCALHFSCAIGRKKPQEPSSGYFFPLTWAKKCGKNSARIILSKQGSTPTPWARCLQDQIQKRALQTQKIPFMHRVYCAQRRIETMVSEGARPWSRGRSEFGRTIRQFSHFDFKEKWPEELLWEIFHQIHGTRNNILSLRDSRGWGSQQCLSEVLERIGCGFSNLHMTIQRVPNPRARNQSKWINW